MDKQAVTLLTKLNSLSRLIGYLAIWPAMYALGVFVIAWRLLSAGMPDADSSAYILLCAHICYLFDRVKMSDRNQDPADALSLPMRTMLFVRWAKPIRTLIIIEWLGATAAGWLIHPLLAGIPVIALGVVYLYAGRGASLNSTRLKDFPGIKAFLIAGGHLSLSLAVIFARDHHAFEGLWIYKLVGIIGLWLIVSGDAALCDIDDHDADWAYHTQSLSVMLGQRKAWWISLAMITLGAAMIANHSSATLSIALTLVLSTLAHSKSTNHRDFVDARLLPIVLFWIWITH